MMNQNRIYNLLIYQKQHIINQSLKMKSLEKLNMKSSKGTFKANIVLVQSTAGKTMVQKLREKIHFQKKQKYGAIQKMEKKSVDMIMSQNSRRKSSQARFKLISSLCIKSNKCFRNEYKMNPGLGERLYEQKKNQRSSPKIKQAFKKIDELLFRINKEKQSLMNENLKNSQVQQKLMLKSSINTNHSQSDQIESAKLEQNLMWEILDAKSVQEIQNPYTQESQQFKTSEDFLTKEQLNQLPTVQYRGVSTSCSVCLEQIRLGDDATCMMCLHFAHPKCCQDWLSKSTKCPLCQIDIKKQLQ